MKIIDAINQLNGIKHNTYSDAQKLSWLSQVEGFIKNEIIDTHEGGGDVAFSGYDENTDMETVLIVPAPYDSVYVRWLEAQVDYANGEFDKYSASILLYNTDFEAFANYYNRTHKPKGGGRRFQF